MDEKTSKMAKDTKEGEVNLLDYVIILAKYSRKIIFSTLIIGMLTYGFLRLVTVQYTAVARFRPPQQNLTLSGNLLKGIGGSGLESYDMMGGMWGMASQMLGLKTGTELYVEILTGNTIYDRIIERFNLKERFQIKIIEYVRGKLDGMVFIKDEQKGLISVEVTDKDPQFAAVMANAFVEELHNLLQGLTRQEAATHLGYLEEERAKATTNLAKAEVELRCFSEKSNVLQIDAQARQMIEYIARLRATIDFKEVELGVLRNKATPYNFDSQKLETEIKGLREKLRTIESEENTTALCSDVMLSAKRVPSLALEYLRLFREAKYQEGIYTLYCKLVELARIDQTRDSAIVYVVDKATPPTLKSKPKRTLVTLVVMGIAFFLLLFFFFAKEYWLKLRESEANTERLDQLRSHLHEWDREVSWLMFLPNKLLSIFRKPRHDQ